MAAVSERVEKQLEDIFGEWIRTDRVERKMYSFDIGAMPKLVKPFTAGGVAGAVVRPSSEEQVIKLVELAQREGFEDYELLRMLRRRRGRSADAIIRRVITRFDKYTKDVRRFRAARVSLLRALLR